VARFTEQMARDEEMGIDQIKQDALDSALENFMDNAFGRLPATAGNTWM